MQAYPEVMLEIAEIGDGLLLTFRRGEGVNLLYQCIKDNPGTKTPQLAERLKVPVKTLERWIKLLRAEGKISFQGPLKAEGIMLSKNGKKLITFYCLISLVKFC